MGDAELLALAAVASDDAGQDPIDLALLRAAHERNLSPRDRRLAFVPFDPSTKRTEATVDHDGQRLRVVKGMPPVVAALARRRRRRWTPTSTGSPRPAPGSSRWPPGRTLTCGSPGSWPSQTDRDRDSGQLVGELEALGIEVKMVTGDTPATAVSVARQVGIDPVVCTGDELRQHPELAAQRSVFAGVFPEDKFTIVQSLQAAGRIVGMTGDGVNDAPALKTAEVGIAVDSAVDVAKAAASIVLTEPGLVDTVTAVSVSRRIYQRMMTWTLNKIIKTAQVALFLTLGFVFTRTFVTTPLLIVLLLLANDFVTMSLAVDRVRPSPPPRAVAGRGARRRGAGPRRRRPRRIVPRPLARPGGLPPQPRPSPDPRVLDARLLRSGHRCTSCGNVTTSGGADPPPGSSPRPSFDVLVVSTMAARGLLMTSLALPYIVLVLGIAVAFMLVMDPVKLAVLRRFRLV